jgi:hypothetical protein
LLSCRFCSAILSLGSHMGFQHVLYDVTQQDLSLATYCRNQTLVQDMAQRVVRGMVWSFVRGILWSFVRGILWLFSVTYRSLAKF